MATCPGICAANVFEGYVYPSTISTQKCWFGCVLASSADVYTSCGATASLHSFGSLNASSVSSCGFMLTVGSMQTDLDVFCLAVLAQVCTRPLFLCRGFGVDALPVIPQSVSWQICVHPGGKLTLPLFVASPSMSARRSSEPREATFAVPLPREKPPREQPGRLGIAVRVNRVS